MVPRGDIIVEKGRAMARALIYSFSINQGNCNHLPVTSFRGQSLPAAQHPNPGSPFSAVLG